jgi:hypothetical protein
MDRCEHPDARSSLGREWLYGCPACGVEGAGHNPGAAVKSFRVNAKVARGERLTQREENIRAWTPFPHGTAASGCPSVVVVRPALSTEG